MGNLYNLLTCYDAPRSIDGFPPYFRCHLDRLEAQIVSARCAPHFEQDLLESLQLALKVGRIRLGPTTRRDHRVDLIEDVFGIVCDELT